MLILAPGYKSPLSGAVLAATVGYRAPQSQQVEKILKSLCLG